MNILVVGSSSFLGKHLISFLLNHSYSISGLQRRSTFDSDSRGKYVSWQLGEPIPDSLLESSDWIVFCAHDLEDAKKTIVGYDLILKQLERFPALKCVYISSYSAFEDAPGDYGQAKYYIEKQFLKRGNHVVRPGLIVGNGGLFAQLYKNILKFPIVPIVGFNDAPIFYIGVQDLAEFIEKIIFTNPKKKEFEAFYQEALTQVELGHAIKKQNKTKFFYIRLPILFFEIIVFCFGILKLKAPISKENLKGYKKNTAIVRSSDFLFLKEDHSKKIDDLLKALGSNKDA